MQVFKRFTETGQRFAIAAALLLSGVVGAQEQLNQNLPTQEFKLGDHTLTVELVTTEAQRSRGLMEREHMGEYEGMLFVYNDHDHRCFWMQNTLIPLTLAFLADSGEVLQTVDMEPLSTQVHCSHTPVRYALELNQGWFERNDVAVGDRLENPQ